MARRTSKGRIEPDAERSLTVSINIGGTAFGVGDGLARAYEVREAVESVVNDRGLGKFDGSGCGCGAYDLFMYTTPANLARLRSAVLTVLKKHKVSGDIVTDLSPMDDRFAGKFRKTVHFGKAD